MLETRFSSSMDMTGKVESLRFEKIDTRTRWVVVEASLAVAATQAALLAAVVLVVAVGLEAVEATEVMAVVEEGGTVEVVTVEAALEQVLRLEASAWKPRTLLTLSPTSQHRAATKIQSSTSEM